MKLAITLLPLTLTTLSTSPLGAAPQEGAAPERKGTRLVFELGVEAARRDGRLDPLADPNEVAREALEVVRKRLDPYGRRGLRAERDGTDRIRIDLIGPDARLASKVKATLAWRGRFAMRVLATADYAGTDATGAPVTFDLAAERRRMTAWLADGDNRRRVARDPSAALREFRALSRDDRGRLSKWLRWCPRKIGPSKRDPSKWDYAHPRALPVYGDAERAAGPGPDGAEFLVELHAVNLHETAFTAADMRADGVRASVDPASGLPCVLYEMLPERAGAYADLSEDYRGKGLAILIEDDVLSAPTFMGRIVGRGMITGGLDERGARELADALRSGPLPIVPKLVSEQPIR